jgi:hypothetical protein
LGTWKFLMFLTAEPTKAKLFGSMFMDEDDILSEL